MFGRLKTIKNVKHIEGDLYRVEYHADYKLDALLKQGIKNASDLIKFVSKKMFFSYPIKIVENYSACTAFTATTPEGKLIVGRNFDYPKTGAILVHTRSKNAYASYSMVCLKHLDICEES